MPKYVFELIIKTDEGVFLSYDDTEKLKDYIKRSIWEYKNCNVSPAVYCFGLSLQTFSSTSHSSPPRKRDGTY
jgi:hypothetical protein